MTGCYKNGSSIIENPPNQPPAPVTPPPEISVTTTGKDYYVKTITGYQSSNNMITAPSGTGNVTLKYTGKSNAQVKDVR